MIRSVLPRENYSSENARSAENRLSASPKRTKKTRYMGLQMGLLRESDLAEPIREEIYDNEAKKQVFGYTPAW